MNTKISDAVDVGFGAEDINPISRIVELADTIKEHTRFNILSLPASSIHAFVTEIGRCVSLIDANLAAHAVPVAVAAGISQFGVLECNLLPGGLEQLQASDGEAKLYLHPQPAALNEVSGNPGELGGDAPGITDKWVLEYLDTDAPEASREAIRNAFAEWNSLADADNVQFEKAWRIAADHHHISKEAAQFIWQAALAATGKQQGGEGQGDALLESLVTRWRKDADELGTYDNTLCQKIANCTMRHAAELQAVISARQPMVSRVGPGPYLDEPDSQHHPLWKRLRSIANWLADIAPNCHMEAAQLLLTASSIVKRNEEQPAQGIDLGQFRSAVEGWRESLDRVVADTSATQSARRVAAGRVGEAIRLLALIDQRDAGAKCNCHPETCACDSQLGRSR